MGVTKQPDFSGIRVLLADDNDAMRTLLRSILRAIGVRCIVNASDGEHAFAVLGQGPVDLVIADWKMDPVDGLGLLRRIRGDPTSPDPYVPIIMVSGYTDLERIGAARDCGINEFVAKPFTVRVLLSRIASVIESPRRFVRTDTFFGPDRRRRASPDYGRTDRRNTPPRLLEPKSQLSARAAALAQPA